MDVMGTSGQAPCQEGGAGDTRSCQVVDVMVVHRQQLPASAGARPDLRAFLLSAGTKHLTQGLAR